MEQVRQRFQFFKCLNVTYVIRYIVYDPAPLVEIDKELEIGHRLDALDSRHHLITSYSGGSWTMRCVR